MTPLFKDKNKDGKPSKNFMDQLPDEFKIDGIKVDKKLVKELKKLHESNPAYVKVEADVPLRRHEQDGFMETLDSLQDALQAISSTFMVNLDVKVSPAKVRERLFKHMRDNGAKVKVTESKHYDK